MRFVADCGSFGASEWINHVLDLSVCGGLNPSEMF